MRTREEIENDAHEEVYTPRGIIGISHTDRIILETLLDIRDLLAPADKVSDQRPIVARDPNVPHAYCGENFGQDGPCCVGAVEGRACGRADNHIIHSDTIRDRT